MHQPAREQGPRSRLFPDRFVINYNSEEECRKVKAFAVYKNEENFDRLESELAKMAAAEIG